MLTQDQIAAMLASVRVEDVAREAGVSTKTIYRLRHRSNLPNLKTLNAILEAIDRLKSAEQQVA